MIDYIKKHEQYVTELLESKPGQAALPSFSTTMTSRLPGCSMNGWRI